jgi:hypothetical protein
LLSPRRILLFALASLPILVWLIRLLLALSILFPTLILFGLLRCALGFTLPLLFGALLILILLLAPLTVPVPTLILFGLLR